LTIRHIGLVNIVADRTVCPELIQRAATPSALAEALGPLLEASPERSAMLSGYEEVRQLLGSRDAAEKVAEALLEA
jgi:lipid-A-disaccharide synthase